MPFHDLNVVYAQNDGELSNTLAFCTELDYTVIAVAIQITTKLPAQLPVIPLEHLRKTSSIKILSRLTLPISDNAQNHRINNLTTSYDLVALRPTDDKTFALCCSSLECDIISLDFAQRINYPIKFKTVASALQRGVRFEICYSPGVIGSNDTRRNLISGASSLIRATRGRGIILNSEAKTALGVRGPWDVVNLAQVWGLSQERAKEAVCEESARVVYLAHMKRASFRGVVEVTKEDSQHEETTTKTKSAVVYEHAKASDVDSTDPINTVPVSTALPQVTVVPSKTPNPEKAKRKASALSLTSNDAADAVKGNDNKQLSKREQKRQAKKARLERALGT